MRGEGKERRGKGEGAGGRMGFDGWMDERVSMGLVLTKSKRVDYAARYLVLTVGFGIVFGLRGSF